MKRNTILIILFLAMIVPALFFGIISCNEEDADDDDDDDDDWSEDDDDDGDWLDDSVGAHEDCLEFNVMMYECFDMPLDQTAIEFVCSGFKGWEDLYGEDHCLLAALDDFHNCVSLLKCDDFADFNGFNGAYVDCAEGYSEDAVDCFGMGDDDDTSVDDDDDDFNAPQIFDPFWDPNPVAYDAAEDYWVSTTIFGLCDPDNDLIGGAIYIYIAGSTELLWAEAPEWADFTGLDDVSDCNVPVEVGMGTIFAEGEDPPGWSQELCTDMEVSDGDGNFSNLETNFCVLVP